MSPLLTHLAQLTLKHQGDGGTAIQSIRHGTWAVSELRTSMNSYRFIPAIPSATYARQDFKWKFDATLSTARQEMADNVMVVVDMSCYVSF